MCGVFIILTVGVYFGVYVVPARVILILTVGVYVVQTSVLITSALRKGAVVIIIIPPVIIILCTLVLVLA